jgi:hypothetical protein
MSERRERMDRVVVVLNNGAERKVPKDELQYLLTTRQVMFFQRSEGWVVCGRDAGQMRQQKGMDYTGEERRQHSIYASYQWV